ncbi:hypothetical protein RHMOL_Rhmol11G0107700 [Rhododendron molle]|uniref:Uncharacterized protein n=1 Tax=Rhododendron molle TaxID=49168 RepID=A0ACC0LQS0_RHOML|nr:hypothetical protein RHMOL_Rhmol11G0107700 [Rhododendron molle]
MTTRDSSFMQWPNFARDLCTTLTKPLDWFTFEDEAEVGVEQEDDDELFGVEERESLELISLSSSLIVSKTFDALCLMTHTSFGGATSVTNLAMRAFAILLVKSV